MPFAMQGEQQGQEKLGHHFCARLAHIHKQESFYTVGMLLLILVRCFLLVELGWYILPFVAIFFCFSILPYNFFEEETLKIKFKDQYELYLKMSPNFSPDFHHGKKEIKQNQKI